MPLRMEIAYGLIALLVIAALFGVVILRRRLREERRIERGNSRPFKR